MPSKGFHGKGSQFAHVDAASSLFKTCVGKGKGKGLGKSLASTADDLPDYSDEFEIDDDGYVDHDDYGDNELRNYCASDLDALP